MGDMDGISRLLVFYRFLTEVIEWMKVLLNEEEKTGRGSRVVRRGGKKGKVEQSSLRYQSLLSYCVTISREP